MTPQTLEQLLHETECTFLDFKRDQYLFVRANDHVKSELLKDILALANARKRGAGYILIGVEENRGSRAKVVGVTNHLNDHDLQQFVTSRINRPIVFSYEVIACDGVFVGAIHIPAQDGPFFLKHDYGKLKANAVYYRLGSSTREAAPDELLRWAQEAAEKSSQPFLQIQFARIARPTAIGGSPATGEVGTSLTARIRKTAGVPGTELAKLCPPSQQFGFTREAEYWTGFCRFLRFGLLCVPVGLALRNTGQTTATDVRVHLTTAPQSTLKIFKEEVVPARPLHTSHLKGGGLFASHSKFSAHDIEVLEEPGQFKVIWKIAKALPHLPVFSEGMFYVSAPEAGSHTIQCIIFAENLPCPATATLTICLEQETKDLSLEEIQNFSEAITADDIKTGRGRVA